jgi:GNAT superfamily N-acetyltransferase
MVRSASNGTPSSPSPSEVITADRLTIVPANQVGWPDLQAVFGTADYPGRCYCQRFRVPNHWGSLTDEERRARLREQTNCDNPAADDTTGLVAYLDDEPVGWVAIAPRVDYRTLHRRRTVWAGRHEDKTDETVWAVTCFCVRRGYRGRGITYALAAATIPYARERGARAVEGYPMSTPPGMVVTWGEMHVGSKQVFEAAGFAEVSQPSLRRVVMRVDFADWQSASEA